MTPNDAQKAWLINQGHLSAAILEQVQQSLPDQSDLDLCGVLLQKGLLSAEQADYVRNQVSAHHSPQISPVKESGQSPVSSSDISDLSSEIPGYRIVQQLGQGGMGVVYKGIQESTGAEVVIKKLLGDRVSAEAAARFQREAQVLAQFSHSNIVPIRDFGMNHNDPYLVMGFVPGQDLGQIIRASFKSEPLPLTWILNQFKTLTKALVDCHDKGIIHRDLKPSNIMIEEETERPVIIDFGLAAATEGIDGQSLAELTKTGAMIGTPAFMAPEQFDKKHAERISDKADVWGLGATLFYCLTGQTPFPGDNPFSIYKQILDNPAPLPSAIHKDLPPWLDTLCREMLHVQPELRPTMAQVSATLEDSRWSPRKPVTICLIILALLAALLAGLGVYSQYQDRTRPSTPEFSPENQILSGKDINEQIVVFTKNSTITVNFQSQDENPGDIIALNTVTKKKTRGQFQNNNQYSLSFTLKTGKNQFLIKTVDRFKNASKPLIFTIVRDADAPEVESWSLPEKIDLESQSGPLQFKIAGTLNEDACEVFFGSERATVDRRKFSATITLNQSRPKLTLTIFDRVKNKAVVPIPVCVVSNKAGTTYTHKTIGSALRNAPEVRRIFVRPGEYRDSLRLSKSIDIIGTEPAPAVVIVPARGSAVEIDSRAPNPKVQLRDLQLTLPDSSKVDLFKIVTGSLSLQNCTLRSGRGGIGRCLGTLEKKEAQPQLTLKNCKVQRRGPFGIIAEFAQVLIEGCQFFDEQESTISRGPGLTNDSQSVYYHTGFLQVGRQALLTVDKSRFHQVKDRHIFVVHGTATLNNSNFGPAVHEAFIFGIGSTIQLRRIQSSENNKECISATLCKSLLIEHCIFNDGGSGNIMNVDSRQKLAGAIPMPAIRIDRVPKVVIRHSIVRDYKGGGLLMSGEASMTLLLDHSRFTNNLKTGIRLNGCTVTMKNCEVSRSGASGIVTIGTRASIEGGQISKNKFFAVHAVNKSQVKLSGVRMDGNLKSESYKDDSSTIQK